MCTTLAQIMSVAKVPSELTSVPVQSPQPIQQIPRATSARIEDAQGKLVAVGGLVRYSTNQAYFILQHLDSHFAGEKAVTIYTPDEDSPLNLRIGVVKDSLPDRSSFPMYIQVHWNAEERLVLEHLVDNLAETSLGRRNLELKKNLTIDMFDSDGDAYLRDNAGFIVADRLRFQQVTVEGKQLMSVLKPQVGIVVEKAERAEQRQLAMDYDSVLSPYNRAEFLEFLSSKSRIYIARAKPVTGDASIATSIATTTTDSTAAAAAGPEALGYMAVSTDVANPRILCLYAESEGAAHALISHYLKESRAQKVIFCTTLDNWAGVESLSSFRGRVIYRRHTRALPANVKWEKIFCVNVGMYLF